jgi:two-component system nitrogen regulation response regulator GlnG
VLFDEVGDLSPPDQTRVLRFLDEHADDFPGESGRQNVRVLAATSRDLEDAVRAGWFRADLYYRLKVTTLCVPPLREHPEDIPELGSYFLSCCDEGPHAIAPATLERLQAYPWPGNVRQLRGIIAQAALLSPGPILQPESLPVEIREPGTQGQAGLADAHRPRSSTIDLEALIASSLEESPGRAHRRVIEAVERVLLARVLRQTRGHQGRASELLGLDRATLRSRLRAMGLTVCRCPTVAGDAQAPLLPVRWPPRPDDP